MTKHDDDAAARAARGEPEPEPEPAPETVGDLVERYRDLEVKLEHIQRLHAAQTNQVHELQTELTRTAAQLDHYRRLAAERFGFEPTEIPTLPDLSAPDE